MTSKPDRLDQVRIELEGKIGFLEHTVDALNEVILQQGNLMEGLERRLERLESRVATEGEGDSEESDPLLERPPHY